MENVFSALLITLTPVNLLILIGGGIFGLVAGIIPGLSSSTALILLIPLTFGMDSSQAFILLMGAMGASMVGGSMTAILIGIPGAGVNSATLFDGFPLAQQGKAGLALGASASASAIGGLIGVFTLAAMLPLMKLVVLAFGPSEFLLLALWGLLIIGLLSGRSMLDGLISACIGLAFSFVGFNVVEGGIRYTFGIDYLWDGIKMPPFFIGMFAIAAVINLAVKGVPIAGGQERPKNVWSQIWEGICAPIHHFGLTIRSSIMGTIIGAIPGIGGTVAAFLTYGQTLQSAKDKSMFGKGDIRGVIGPETSNNATMGGSLIPTFTFGIPGSDNAALLLGAFAIHGLTPGPEMIRSDTEIIWVIIWALALANVLGSVIYLAASPQLFKLTFLNPVYLVPPILAMSLVGAYAFNRSILDVIVALGIGLLGYTMDVFNISKVPAVIAYILGPLAEKSFFQTIQIGQGSFWAVFSRRPLTIFLTLVIVVTILAPYVGSLRAYGRRKEEKGGPRNG